jgi:hypothetical protein
MSRGQWNDDGWGRRKCKRYSWHGRRNWRCKNRNRHEHW